MIGNMNEGMEVFLDWNLVLDEFGGPNHVKNYCDAPFLYDMEKKELTETNILVYLWHISHFIEPGAVRIGVSRYTDKLEVTAFQKDNRIVFVLLNSKNAPFPKEAQQLWTKNMEMKKKQMKLWEEDLLKAVREAVGPFFPLKFG